MSSVERELTQDRHAQWKVENLAALRASGVPFQERPEACLFRVSGKPPVDFYPSTGRWRVVAGKKKTLRGGATAFLAWYAKQVLPPSPASQAAAVLLRAGFAEDGHTREETVRVGTSRSPVYGGIGGELRTSGGRARFVLPGTDIRVTVGQRTVCIYRRAGREPEFFGTVETKRFTMDVLKLTLNGVPGAVLRTEGA